MSGVLTQDAVKVTKSIQSIKDIKTIAVVGAGQMGNGIVHVFAQSGFKVHMIDIAQSALDKAVGTIAKNMDRQLTKGTITEEQKQQSLDSITTFTDLGEGIQDADLVVEAATESIDLKIRIFKDIDRLAPAHAILATNTSSISITRIASHTSRPTQVIGMHFMNPVPVMKLVEIINGYATAKEVTNIVNELSSFIGKVPCVVNDYPGFIANRILMPMINEAISALQESVAGVAEIDTIMKLGMAHPMGPLQLADFIGLDTCFSIMNVLHMGFGAQKYAPATLLANMVQAGFLGVKSGEGFYKYTPGSKELVVSDRFVDKAWKG